MKNNRGEVTIMMVITVIVLIILGGICIFMLTGENGIFVPKRNIETTNTQNQNTQVITDNTQEETNNTENQNGALTVPMQ